MADHNKPTVTSNYLDFVHEMHGRMDDLAVGFDPARTSATNVPNYSIRWSSVAKKWQYLDGSSWKDLTNEYAINISGSAAKLKNARTIRTDLSSTSAPSFDGTGNITPGVTGTLPISRGGTGGATASSARTNLGLGSAATRDVGTSSGNVMEVGAGTTWGRSYDSYLLPDGADALGGANLFYRDNGKAHGVLGINVTHSLLQNSNYNWQIAAKGYNDPTPIFRSQAGGAWGEAVEGITTGNILKTTGNNDNYPMSQKAVTDALNTKANISNPGSMGIGVGQTWQDVTGSRVAGTTYTNTTGRPIMVAVSTRSLNTSSSRTASFLVGGIVIYRSSATTSASKGDMWAVVPSGSTYKVELSGAIEMNIWAELR